MTLRQIRRNMFKPVPEIIKDFFSSQLSMIFILLINGKMTTNLNGEMPICWHLNIH